jgi:23S rRNA-/tRNA-specific pseudouridylate synthase
MTDSAADVRVLHRDADLLVLFKPAGLSTTSPDGRGCLTEIAARLDPHAPRLHASSRLDAEVTGIVTFARTTRAIAGLLEARQAGQYERYYLGLAVGAPEPPAGHFDWPIDRDPRDPRKRVALEPAGSSQRTGKLKGQEARTRYRVLHALPTAALLLLSPLTGRTHQLRVHVARAGVPLLGDRHYGGPVKQTLLDGRVLRAGRVMLHCARVRLPKFEHAAELQKLTLDAPIPDDFRALWLALGGELSSLDSALSET